MLARNNQARRQRAAFTLMELLIVVAIIVVLATIGGVVVLPMLGEAKESIAYTKAKTLEQRIGMYMTTEGAYPESVQNLVSPPSGKRGMVDTDSCLDPWGQPYNIGPIGADSKPYVYTTSPDGKLISNYGIGVGQPGAQ